MKKSLKPAGFLTALVLLVTAYAAEDQKIFPYPYQMKDLDNGLRVIVVETGYPNIVSLQIPVATGSRNEVEPGRSGFAHFFEHMMFRGTKKYPAEKYNALLKNMGADQNAYTTDDYTNYHITFSKEDLETVLMLEADRFMNLDYSVEDFKTEARAVLGEYNKNYANPIQKLIEVQRNRAYTKHTYKHTTMGFIEDIENMPEMYDYSRTFFDRFYRPEYCTVIVAGDVKPDHVFGLVEKYWSSWERGDYVSEIPVEPPSTEPIYEHIEWETPTLPWLTVAFHGPASSETELDMRAMDLISQVAFSSSSPLYQKLVIKEQKVQSLFGYFPNQVDPGLLTVGALLKNPGDVWYVRDEIQKELARLRFELTPAKRLTEIKSAMKYGFANGMDNTADIAAALAGSIPHSRDPETLNRTYKLYDKVTPEILRDMANKYFVDKGMIVVTLAHGALPETDQPVGTVDGRMDELSQAPPEIQSLIMKTQSPLINFRIQFTAGSANDPEGKEGLATLTAAMVSDAGSRTMSYKDIQQSMYPMAAGFGGQVDKELTTFVGAIHRDNLQAYYGIIRDMLLQPAFDEEDFTRVKSDLINNIKVALRGNNDEELGKEVLYENIYAGHPYGHLNMGSLSAIEAMTTEDVKGFYQQHYNRANLILGMAGGFDDAFVGRVKRDLGQLPEGTSSVVALPAPAAIDGLQVTLVNKETRATGISMGFPIDVNRAHKDFAALWLIRSYFGEHRSTNSYLFQRIREIRGMNYGDYAYIEYFPGGMFQFHPDPNNARRQQIFQMWIRPVVPTNGHFALRIAKYELDKLVREGISEEDFEATRNYLVKFANVLTASQSRQLGYALDSRFYDIPEFTDYIRKGLEKLTHKEVNRVLKEHLQGENMHIVLITPGANELRDKLLADAPSPIKYDADKPQAILDEDKIIESYKLNLKPENVKVVDVEEVFK